MRYAWLIVIMVISLGCSLVTPKNEVPDILPEEIRCAVDKVDPAIEDAEYPGNRGPGEMIVYTPDYGTRTGTNPWGYEAVVAENTVIRLNKNDSSIPRDGFVISGHGDAARWITINVIPGAKAYIEGRELIIRYPARSVIEVTGHFLEKAHRRLEQREPNMVPVRRIKKYFKQAREYTSEAAQTEDPKKARRLAIRGFALAKKGDYLNVLSIKGELRAAWVRLYQKNPAQIRALVDNIHRAGFNAVFPETVFEGYTLYPSPEGMIPQHRMYRGWDPLEVFIEECHSRGIQVHAWCHVFFVGFGSPLIGEHRGWLARDRHGNATSSMEQGYHFFCPANRDARSFLQENFAWLVRHYDLDGFQFDYIRYPQTRVGEQEYCFCRQCQREYFGRYEEDLVNLNPGTHPERWEEWSEKRRHDIDSFARETLQHLEREKPGLMVSADVFARPEEALNNVFQPWLTWAGDGIFDFLCPMAYTYDTAELRDSLEEARKTLTGGTPYIIGLGYFIYRDIGILTRQVQAVRSFNYSGQAIFSLNHFTDRDYRLLGDGIYRSRGHISLD